MEELPQIRVFSPEYESNPEGLFKPIRAQGDLARSERGLEVLSYEGNQEIFKDPVLIVDHHAALVSAGLGPEDAFYQYILNENALNTEGALHKRLRSAIAPILTPKRVEEHRASTRESVGAWLKELKIAGRCEFMADIAQRLPASLFCRIAGLPPDMEPKVYELSNGLNKLFLRDARYRDVIAASYDEMSELSETLLERARGRGRRQDDEVAENLVDRLIAAEQRGLLRPEETAGRLIEVMFGAAEATSKQLGLMLMALHEHKEHWNLLKKDPEKIRPAVQELARYRPGLIANGRVAAKTTEFRGVKVEAGSMIWSNVLAGNWDPSVFPDPHRLDFHREGAFPPLNWGAGHHSCVGRVLAVMELEEALAALLVNWRDFHIEGEPEMSGSPFAVGPGKLEIRFDSV